MVSQALHSPTLDGRRNYRTSHGPYQYPLERRTYPAALPHHHSRALTMADSHGEDSCSNQRKRISVACGRCRKRKIRCSGDPGGGQPCSNCKSAGIEPCQFLRVQSTEAAMRSDPNDFPYNVQDASVARNLGNRSVAHSVPYAHDLPHVASPELIAGNSYRGASTYSSYTKPFYPPMPGYPMGYVEEYSEYPTLNNSTQSALGHDMVPYPTWTAREYGYGGTTSLVHRPAPSVTSDSANFSLHNIAAHLPNSPVGMSDRMLPAPSSRSGLMAYTSPGSHPYRALPPAGSTGDPSPVHAAAALADMATGTYQASFDTSGLPYSSSSEVSLPSHASNDPLSSRTNSEPYSPDTGSIFTPHDQSLRTEGSAVELSAYTYSGVESGSGALRRGSTTSGCPTSANSTSSTSNGGSGRSGSGACNGAEDGGGGNTTVGSSTSSRMSHSHHSQQHVYVPASSIQDSASSHPPHHPHQLPLVSPTGGSSGSTASAMVYLAESHALPSGPSPSGTGYEHHADTRRPTVGGRR